MMSTIGSCEPTACGRPSIVSCRWPTPPIGSVVVVEPPSRPPTLARRSSTRWRNNARSSTVRYFRFGNCIRIVSRCEVSTPMSVRYKIRKLRIMKPAPASRTSVSASSAMMSAPVHRRARDPDDPVRPPSFNTSFRFVLEMCSAGARPNVMPVATHARAKNVNTRALSVNTIQYGLPTFCVTASNALSPKIDKPRPTRPPTKASSTLSTSSCRITCRRVAPTEKRIPISLARSAARASSRFATFAQAISSTKTTAPINDQSTVRMGPPAVIAPTRSTNGVSPLSSLG